MKIVVLLKEVPDTYDPRRLDLTTGLADRDASDALLDEIGERALEVALTIKDRSPDTEVVTVTMGPATAEAALRKSLSMGADRAVHILDPGLAGADLLLTAQVLGAAVRSLEPDLVITGNQSTDGTGGVMAAMVAETWGVRHASNLGSVEIDGQIVFGRRLLENGTVIASAELPAVISITEVLPEPRFPSFKGIMAAKKKPLDTVTAQELGVDLAGASRSQSIVIAVAERPARTAGTKIADDGTAGLQLAEYLAAQRLA